MGHVPKHKSLTDRDEVAVWGMRYTTWKMLIALECQHCNMTRREERIFERSEGRKQREKKLKQRTQQLVTVHMTERYPEHRRGITSNVA
jgi:hypothetical protein